MSDEGCPPKEPRDHQDRASIKGLETLKILAYSKVHVSLENNPSFLDLVGSLPECIQLFY